MSASSENVVCRLATTDDYEAVVNIDTNIHDGLDYVQARFHKYLSSPYHYPFVLEKDGQIVVFVYVYVVDDGNAVVFGGGRTRADLRRGGLNTRLGEYATSVMRRERPLAMQRVLYTAYDSPFQNQLMETGHAKLLLRRGMMHYVTNMESLRRRIRAFRFKMLSRKYGIDHVITPQKQDLVELLMSSPKLFPGDCFIASFEPYRLMASNLEYVADDCVCQITPSSGRTQALAASFIIHYECKVGLRFDLEFYGSESDLLLQHLLAALIDVSKLEFEGDVNCLLYFPLDIDRQEIIDVIDKDFNWKKGEQSKYHTYLALEAIDSNTSKL